MDNRPDWAAAFKEAFTHNQFWWVVVAVLMMIAVFLLIMAIWRPMVLIEVVQTKAKVTPVVDKLIDVVGKCTEADTLACQAFWGKIISGGH